MAWILGVFAAVVVIVALASVWASEPSTPKVGGSVDSDRTGPDAEQ